MCSHETLSYTYYDYRINETSHDNKEKKLDQYYAKRNHSFRIEI